MSRRDRDRARLRSRPAGYVDQGSHPVIPTTDAPGPSLREQLERASPSARALLPIRFFFGLTFVYAGIDKLVDPAFFDAASPGSIVGQLIAFTHASPLAPLIRIVEPFAVPMGLLIALGEIAIGLGALTGLAFRLAAVGGLVLSLTFWLTASWGTHPYYYGPDLPYAIGWLALLIGGHGNLLVPRAVREMGRVRLDAWDVARLGGARSSAHPQVAAAQREPSPERRLILPGGGARRGGARAGLDGSPPAPLRQRQDGRRGDRGGGRHREPCAS